MKVIDVQGKSCPIPLIMTKKALSELVDNETLEIIIDNEISMKNVSHFLNEHKMKVHTEQHGNVFRLKVSKTGHIPEETNVEAYCSVDSNTLSNYVMVVKRDRMGDGAEELGQILIKAAINTISDLDLKPKKVIFFNSGIFMTLKDSPVIESIRKLEQIGIEMMICGTCLDYYGKKDELGAGRISNMYDILGSMSEAGKVIFL